MKCSSQRSRKLLPSSFARSQLSKVPPICFYLIFLWKSVWFDVFWNLHTCRKLCLETLFKFWSALHISLKNLIRALSTTEDHNLEQLCARRNIFRRTNQWYWLSWSKNVLCWWVGAQKVFNETGETTKMYRLDYRLNCYKLGPSVCSREKLPWSTRKKSQEVNLCVSRVLLCGVYISPSATFSFGTLFPLSVSEPETQSSQGISRLRRAHTHCSGLISNTEGRKQQAIFKLNKESLEWRVGPAKDWSWRRRRNRADKCVFEQCKLDLLSFFHTLIHVSDQSKRYMLKGVRRRQCWNFRISGRHLDVKNPRFITVEQIF